MGFQGLDEAIYNEPAEPGQDKIAWANTWRNTYLGSYECTEQDGDEGIVPLYQRWLSNIAQKSRTRVMTV